MKIAQVVSTFPPYKGGIGNTAYYFAVTLQKLGSPVKTFFPLYNSNDEIFNNELEIRAIKPLISLGNAAFIPGLYNALQGYDLIFFHYPFFGGVEPLIIRKLIHPRQKLVIYYHQDSLAPKDWLKQIIFYFYNIIWLPLIIRLADKIIVSSLDYARNSNLAKYYHNHEAKFLAIPFGVDKNIFHPLKDDNDKTLFVKQKINYTGKESIVIYVGNLSSTHYFKGVDILMAAAAELMAKNNNLKLCLVGRGDLVDKFRKQAQELKIADNVYVLNNLDDEAYNILLNLSKVLVLPSINRAEAFGLVLIEAMATGVPVIASDLPGVRQVFEEKISGLSFKTGDVHDLANKIETIINNPQLQSQMAQAALIKAQSYDWARAASDLKNIFTEINKDN